MFDQAGRWLKAATLLFLFSAVSAHAQDTQAPQSIRIKDIRVEGAETSSPSAIISYSGLRIGDMITPTGDLISRAIKNLFERRLFSDVKVYAQNKAADGVTIVIVVKEYARVGTVTFVGNDELSEKDLKEQVSVKTGEIASPYEIDRSREKIKSKYADEGYLFTKVDVTRTPSADSDRVDLSFAINEGPEVKIGTIAFVGNKSYDASDLKGVMEDVKEKSWWQVWRSSKFDRSKLKKDEGHILDFYRTHGFIDAEVISDSIAINKETGKADILIALNEGTQVYLRSLAISGNTVYPTKNLVSRLDMEVGKPYNQTQLNTNLKGAADESISTLYLDNGYLNFNADAIENRVTPDSVDVTIRVTEGPQASIRYVSIAGNTKTMDKVIRRELFTHPGDTFSKAAVIRSLRNLANLNYFNPEHLQPEVTPVDNTTVDVTYDVEERPSDSFNASLGLSSLGLTVSLGLSFNNFSVAEPFTGGAGQVLNFTWEYGGYLSTFSLGLTEPWLFDTPTTLGANVFYQTEDLSSVTGSSYSLKRAGAAVTLGRRLVWPDDYFRADLALRYQQNDVTGDQSQTSYYVNGSELSATLTLSRSSIDNPIFPTVGSRFSFANTLAGLGDAKYSKHELHYDFYSPLAQLSESNTLVFYLNNEFGYLNALGPIANIPPLTFYSMGGTAVTGYNTVPLRGYRDRSIGPTGLDQIPLGKAYAKVTSELRFGISQNPIPIFILAFAEAGNVWGSLREVDPFDLKRSAGLGIRIMIPGVGGLLGFDYGYGFDSDSFGSNPGWQFHFQFGR